MPTFPTFQTGLLDSRAFEVTPEDPAMRTEMEGGYVITRKKHTRRPRRTFTASYRGLNDADRDALDDFWDLVGGGSVVFDWTNPEDSVVYAVRFKEAYRLVHTGRGPTRRWDCLLTFEQA